jgi:hypothetical protein
MPSNVAQADGEPERAGRGAAAGSLGASVQRRRRTADFSVHLWEGLTMPRKKFKPLEAKTFDERREEILGAVGLVELFFAQCELRNMSPRETEGVIYLIMRRYLRREKLYTEDGIMDFASQLAAMLVKAMENDNASGAWIETGRDLKGWKA